MKSKKLLITLAIVAVLIVIVVILASVLTVKKVTLIYHDFSGKQIQGPEEGAIAPANVLSFAKGKSIVFLNKANLMEDINNEFKGWHAFAVIKEAPSTIVVHIVKREAIAQIQGSEGTVYVDSFGYSAAKPTDSSISNLMDITSAFSEPMSFTQKEIGKPLQFTDSANNQRLNCVINALLSIWQCKVDVKDFAETLGTSDVFKFENGDMLITPKMGGQIVVQSPDANLTDRLIDGFGVYYNGNKDLHDSNFKVVIGKNGKITTTSK